MEDRKPRWGEGKSLLGIWKPNPENLLIPETVTDADPETESPEEKE